MITYETVLRILRTLPIGYYFKNKINVSLSSEEPTSFINLNDLEIIISYPQIEAKAKFVEDGEDYEKLVRTLLYHEVSHAILTPIINDLGYNPDIFNIFEDRRIETINRKFFMNVDFEWAIRLGQKALPDDDPITTFFNKVRLGKGTLGEQVLINIIILEFKDLDNFSYYGEKKRYAEKIYQLYLALTNPKPLIFEEPMFQNESTEPVGGLYVGDSCMDIDISKKLFGILNIENENKPSNFERRLRSILYRANKLKGNTETVIAKTSGKINARLLTKPDNIKWFTNKGDGSKSKLSKVRFNLFIDQSGSFANNFKAVNNMLKCLTDLENEIKNIEFEIVTIDNEIKICPKNKRFINTTEKRFYGNSLNPELYKIYSRLQSSKIKVINIILFSGDAICDVWNNWAAHSELQAECFSAFNHNNCIIISDFANKEYIDKYCKKAKVKYISSKDYLEKFEDEILNKIQIFL